MRYDVVIVGASHAGAQAAIALRERNFDGSILMVGEDPALPGERSPLSRRYRLGAIEVDSVAPPGEGEWAEQVDLWLGDSVTAIDTRRSAVTLRAGGRIGYGHCILAAGVEASAALAASAGIAPCDGMLADAAGRTSCPKVSVVGEGAPLAISRIVDDLAV